MATLDTPLDRVVGGKSAAALEQELSLRTAGELLNYWPRRYEKRGELTDLGDLEPGAHVTVQATVAEVKTRKMRYREGHIVEVKVTDGRHVLLLTFFGKKWRERQFVAGRRGLFAGQVTIYNKVRQLAHPAVLLEGDGQHRARRIFDSPLLPVYGASPKVSSWHVDAAVGEVLDVFDWPPDPLPTELRRRHGLLDWAEAVRGIHRPADEAELRAARRRLTWDEALLLQVALARRRRGAAATPARPLPRLPGGLLADFDARLPFPLTGGQQRVAEEIFADLARPFPMQRLLAGEVGSGKTVVALRAMLAAVDAGAQAVLLAPTEVLATQHARSLATLLGPLGCAGELGSAENATRVALLTGSLGAAGRRRALDEAADGTAGLVVGTHALLEERVRFRDLGLVVVDEQHRFGVEQRDALRTRGRDGDAPHVLVMTATPIPRTVAMTVFGDLEVSELRELPADRAGVATHVVPAGNGSWVARMWSRVREEVAAGRQGFVICPRIEPDDSDDGVSEGADAGAGPGGERGAAVVEVAPRLARDELAGLRVAALHGRLAADEKDRIMTSFARGEVDVLVSTTVVEVGVDVPNATVMVVLDADRFGVSQLHQLRGRVARGSAPGTCLLHTGVRAGPAVDRLRAVAATTDGHELARLDLAQRREGDVLGAAQSGTSRRLRLLSLLDDEDVIVAARAEAARIVDADPDLTDRPGLRAQLDLLVEPERAAYLEKV